jgi:dihydrolipoamide dehydrogenase
LNVGCIPSKALLNASHMYEDVKHMGKFGIKINGTVEIDLPGMMAQKDKAVSGLTGGVAGLFKKNKVTYAKGAGSFLSPNEIQVTAADGTKSIVKAKNVIIATGSEVMPLPGITIDEKSIVSSTGALSLSKVPKRMIVIGGGIIGLELGSVWRRLGSQVTVVEFTDRIAAGADGDIVTEFTKELTKQGMQFKMQSKVTGAVQGPNGVTVTIEPAKGGPATKMECDVVLVSVGRRPYTAGLALEKAGVKVDNRGRVAIDDHWRTNVPHIYAIGDVVQGPMLAHKAEEEGIAAAEVIAGKAGHVNYNAIPSVVYTYPEVAWVGLTQEECKAKGLDVKVGKFPMMANSRARTNDTSSGFVKFIADAKTDKVLGVHIISSNAGEAIAETTLALEYGASSEDIARTCHAHPTLSEAVKEAAMATYDKPIHF